VSGCAAHKTSSLADRFVAGAGSPIEIELPEGSAAVDPVVPAGMPAVGEPVPKTSESLTVETEDAALAAALSAVETEPSVEALLDIAAEYRRLGLLDQAYDYAREALDMNPGDGRTRDVLARVWRDWGLPGQGLPEAYRAVAASPDLTAVHNTLGTLLFAVGSEEAARASFERVLALDPGAAYAWNNLCYLSLMDGHARRAEGECGEALRLDPGLLPARHNLALIYAAEGRWSMAEREFSASGDRATVHYNMGIVYLADRRYGDAAEAFDAAYLARPSLVAARDRARDARRLAAAAEGSKTTGK
jgi:tetratricopeptide (TPR) repeat protein